MGPKLIRSLFILLIFLCGVLSGALLQNTLDVRWLHPGGHLPVVPAPPGASTIEHFRKELRLSPPQVEQLNRILDEALREHRDPKIFVQHIRQETVEHIRAMLDPDQKARFEELLKESRGQEAAEQPKR